jgi:hypothetical protein
LRGISAAAATVLAELSPLHTIVSTITEVQVSLGLNCFGVQKLSSASWHIVDDFELTIEIVIGKLTFDLIFVILQFI